jgi:hypothetical protein
MFDVKHRMRHVGCAVLASRRRRGSGVAHAASLRVHTQMIT